MTRKRKVFIMATLIIAGEAIFFMPFIIARVFRPTFLEVFDITNFELGAAFSVYGLVAVGSYFFGGPLADWFPARKLMAIALAVTGIGGIYMVFIPSLPELKVLYGVFGLSTILLFWAALIKSTREWGGAQMQGSAFGILDGGRGLAAAVFGSIALAIFSFFLPSEVEMASPEQKRESFKYVLMFFTSITFLVSIVVLLALPKSATESTSNKFTLADTKKVVKLPSVWLQAIIIVCAYVGYKVTDDFSLMAKEVFGYDEVGAAGIGTLALWLRPIAAVSIGLIADRVGLSKMTVISFSLMVIGGLLFGSGILDPSITWSFILTLIALCIGVFAVRGLYFAIMEEGKVPLALTGTAVGIVSVIGYTPDIFMGPIMGYLIDNSPGATGHQHVFLVLSGFSFVGLIAAIIFKRRTF